MMLDVLDLQVRFYEGKTRRFRCHRSGRVEGEIDYVRILNRVLPVDIRVFGWCPVPMGFNARFSCLSREYNYLFWGENLNLLWERRKDNTYSQDQIDEVRAEWAGFLVRYM